MTAVYALWNGGHSYAPADIDHHLETFPSIAAARDAFTERYRWGRSVEFRYIRGREVTNTPAVDEASSMWLWAEDPRDAGDPYPWKIIEVGPRGAVKVTAA